MGANWRHGPHQAAQKSTSTSSFSVIVLSKLSAVSVMAAMGDPLGPVDLKDTPGGVYVLVCHTPGGIPSQWRSSADARDLRVRPRGVAALRSDPGRRP